MIPVRSTTHFQTRQPKRTHGLVRLSSRLLGIIFLSLLVLAYVAQANQTATKQVKAQSQQAEITDQKQEIQSLKLDIQRAQSSTQLENYLKTRPSDQPLVPDDNVEFLNPSPIASATASPN